LSHRTRKRSGQDRSPALNPGISRQFIRLYTSNDAMCADGQLNHPSPIIQSLTTQVLISGILPHTVFTVYRLI
jgi:hypothetical protein